MSRAEDASDDETGSQPSDSVSYLPPPPPPPNLPAEVQVDESDLDPIEQQDAIFANNPFIEACRICLVIAETVVVEHIPQDAQTLTAAKMTACWDDNFSLYCSTPVEYKQDGRYEALWAEADFRDIAGKRLMTPLIDLRQREKRAEEPRFFSSSSLWKRIHTWSQSNRSITNGTRGVKRRRSTFSTTARDTIKHAPMSRH